MTGSNLPPGANNDPRAPYNREPPTMEKKAMAVTLDVVIDVPEYAESDRERKEITQMIENGDYELIEFETADVLDRGKP